jgi:hypothetical protein
VVRRQDGKLHPPAVEERAVQEDHDFPHLRQREILPAAGLSGRTDR